MSGVQKMLGWSLATLILITAGATSPALWGQEEAAVPKVKRETVVLTLRSNYFSFSDDEYADLYGSDKWVPEIKLSLRLLGNMYLWGSAGWARGEASWPGWSDKSQAVADIEWFSKTTKTIYGVGIGYYAGLITPGEFLLRLEGGLCILSFKDSGTQTFLTNGELLSSYETSESEIGFSIDMGVAYTWKRGVFAEISLAFVSARGPAEEEDETVNWGGFRAGVGVGYRF